MADVLVVNDLVAMRGLRQMVLALMGYDATATAARRPGAHGVVAQTRPDPFEAEDHRGGLSGE